MRPWSLPEPMVFRPHCVGGVFCLNLQREAPLCFKGRLSVSGHRSEVTVPLRPGLEEAHSRVGLRASGWMGGCITTSPLGTPAVEEVETGAPLCMF